MSVEVALKFWEYIDSAQFDKLLEVMQENAVVWCPNTKEVYRNAKKFIDFNKAYPGRWFATVEKTMESCDEVAAVAKVFNEEHHFSNSKRTKSKRSRNIGATILCRPNGESIRGCPKSISEQSAINTRQRFAICGYYGTREMC